MTSTREQYLDHVRAQPVMAAPMCGISDFAYRTVSREFGGPTAWTQMVSAEGMSRNDAATLRVLDLNPAAPEERIAMQIFGSDPDRLAEGARRLQELGACVVDLNMGCPARKVTNTKGGAALLREPELVRRIFRAMRAALTVPFTVKMRWDWDEVEGAALTIGAIAEEEGLDGLCLHGRTREQGYSGAADWDQIRRLKESVSIPVIGNGDVRSPADAVSMIRRTGCDGVMIGRAVIGDPWLLGAAHRAVLEHLARNDDAAPDHSPAADWDERRRVMIRHAELMVLTKGERGGLTQFRKHAAAYMRGLRGGKRLRTEMMKITDLVSLREILNSNRPDTDCDPEPDDAVSLAAGAQEAG